MQQGAAANPEREAALKLLQEKQYTEAAKAWRKFLSSSANQKDAEAWLYLGIALYRDKETEEAREALKKAVKFDPKSEAAHATYATVLYAANKFKDAEKEVNETLKLNAKNPDALYLRGVLRYNKGDYRKALEDAEAVLQTNPQYASAYTLRAQARTGQLYAKGRAGQHDFPPEWKQVFLASAQDLERFLQLNPAASNAEFWRGRASAFRHYGGEKSSSGCAQGNEPGVTRPQILYQEKATYTDEARLYRISGTVIIKAMFDADGRIKHIIPVSHLGGGLTDQAVKAAQKIRFNPATKNGQPVCVVINIEFTFNVS